MLPSNSKTCKKLISDTDTVSATISKLIPKERVNVKLLLECFYISGGGYNKRDSRLYNIQD